jgi:hypothetical protein
MPATMKQLAIILFLVCLFMTDSIGQQAQQPPAKIGYFTLLAKRVKAQIKAYQIFSMRRDGPPGGGDAIVIYDKDTKKETVVLECVGCRSPIVYKDQVFFLIESSSIGVFDRVTGSKKKFMLPDTLKFPRLLDASADYLFVLYESKACTPFHTLSAMDRTTGAIIKSSTYDSCYSFFAPVQSVLNGVYLSNTKNKAPYMILESENIEEKGADATFAESYAIEPLSYDRFDPVWINDKSILYIIKRR